MADNHLQDNKFLVIIAGPTASGKTALAADMAQRFQADVFSADSRQIYREINIGTAKPTPAEMHGVVHHFIGEVSITEPYSAGHYAEDLQARLKAYFTTHDIAILTGGTGLYINALLEGLDRFPEISMGTRSYVRDRYAETGISYLQEELEARDPVYFARVDRSNPRRLMRALEVCLEAGLPYSSFLTNVSDSLSGFEAIMILAERPREELYTRINDRVDKMMEEGLLEEARALLPLRGIQALETVGYKELFDHLEGKTDLQSAVDLIKQNTRRYAKRQMTWFRKYGNWTSFHPEHREDISRFICTRTGRMAE